MQSARFSIMAGTALALVLTISSATVAAPGNSATGAAAQPAPRDYSTPGSMPKPSSMRPDDDGLRFRGSIPATGNPQPVRRELSTPLAPAAPPGPTSEPVQTKQSAPPAPAAASVPPVPTVTETPAPTSAPAPVVRQAPPAVVVKQPVPRPAPAAAGPAFSDSQIADKIRELIASKQQFERLIARKSDRDAIAALYQKVRNFQPLWVAQGAPSLRATDVIEHLKTIDADGLDPKDYPVPKFSGHSADAQAEAELKFTETVLTYSRHAINGRVHFTRVSPNIDYKLVFDADDVLKKIAASNDLPKTLESFNPQQPAYVALKAKLAELRDQPEGHEVRIERGPVLKYSRDRYNREYTMNDARVPILRERLGLAAEPNTTYNLALANAVAKFQKAHGIQATGQLNQPTIDALNPLTRSKQIDAILATMERWRWIPRDLGQTHIMLNIPDYYLRVYHDGAKVWQTKVVVGKPDHQTPLLTETMKFITLNPTWNVPQSIIYNELLPIYETSDPQIFERQGLKVGRNPDGSIRVYQPPGERNALGQIRFNFPNKFLVYQHDTPEKYYFAHEKRAYSHGCMRVQDPLKYAEVLLSYAAPKSGYTAANIQRMLGGQEQQLDFRTQLPVHITYQTAFVDEAGKLQFRDDIYGLDAKLMSILRSSERAVADTAIERPADPNFKPTPEATMRLNGVARGGISSPFALFERVFR
jgi:murein L,D-transpeptidase YcbB/YkuD